MVEVYEVAHLMNHHLSDAVLGKLYQLEIEADAAFSGAAAPT